MSGIFLVILFSRAFLSFCSVLCLYLFILITFIMWKSKFYGVLGTVTTGAYFGSVPAFHAESKHPTSPNDLTLQTVQIFFRHGARTPLRPIPFLEEVEWPKDKLLVNPPGVPSVSYTLSGMDGRKMTRSPHDDKLQRTQFKGGAFAGHLTRLGKQQMYELGKKLRSQYIEKRKFLDPAFKDSEVFVRSTNILRTVESVQWLINGMFDVDKRGNKPVTIWTELDEEEVLYPNVNFCVQLKNVNKGFYKAVDDMPGLEKDRLGHSNVLGYKTDENNTKKLDYQELRDELSARLAHDLYIPNEVRQMLDDINKHATAMLKLMVTGPDAGKRNFVLGLSCGPALHMVTSRMDAAATGKKEVPKLSLYSAHDSMVIALLLALGLFDDKWPPFAADIVFEQYKDKNGEAWVRVLFLGKPQRLGGKNGAEFVSLERFKELLAPFSLSLKEYKNRCGTEADEIEGGEVMDVIGGRKK